MPPRSPRLRRSNAAAFPSSPPILNLSHDTLALVCDLLLPVDVLNLSRSCKSIHNFLHQASSKFVWKAARANVQGLPDCPKWLSEPQFASLCFEDFCFRCLAMDTYSRSPLWPFGIRYCLPCRTATFTTKPLKDFPAGGGGALSRKVLSFYVRDVQEFRAALVAKVGADLAATAALVLALLQEKASDTKDRVEFARECKAWHVQWKAQLAAAARAVKVQRQQDILRKLEDAGYANEVRELGPHYEGLSQEVRAVTDQARPLTEREWNVIRPTLTAFMDGRRELGVRVAFVRQIRSRL
ncbi:hypothetical protein GSI_10967 [Ganoderma sinense ZZ0214-1]|uniref:F-box domain-containing protein n=1 Tax=Ganoderma sinense ZZ0214-1 TaxID=1077348 RepID=A0A2G8S211_9APHY|nr:hypothetical protein GSI_10967 [Ganoderma sinense ZZ0214-1]